MRRGREWCEQWRKFLGSEVVQFILALILFLAILVGSYWFVYLPTQRRGRRNPENEEDSGE